MDHHPPTYSKYHEPLPHDSIEYASHSLWTPTPLDPYAVQRDGVNYVIASQHILEDRLTQKAASIGLAPEYMDTALQELMAALGVRIERNSKSYERLVATTDAATIDDTMRAIIEKARAAAADTQELLRLIKEHPDMISIEFFKRTTPFDMDEYREAYTELQHLVMTLKDRFIDADVSFDFKEKIVTTEPFMTEHGAFVWKERIGEARSVDSHTEIIVKHSMLALPPALQLRGVKHNVIRSENGGQSLNLLPLGISAYFRTADYKTRPGYTSPEDEHRSDVNLDLIAALGERASIHEEVWHNIPPDMREIYAHHANRTAERTVSEDQ
jgi:hypothetical protein